MMRVSEIPVGFKDIFINIEEEVLASLLVSYVIYDMVMETTPEMWQDAEIFIRFRKRNGISVSERQMQNARQAFMTYQLKYIIEHMTKAELVEMFNQLFSVENMESREYTLYDLLRRRFSVDINDLFLVQEKRVVGVKDLKDFDALFEYPAWIEFDAAAKQKIYEMILADEMSDEQIDYFLGVSEKHEDYVDLYPVVKHILMTTQNAHTFWTAGDVLNLIWTTAPQDKKMQKWFNDEIFGIFWPRVGSTWPILHEDEMELKKSEATDILHDSIGWLKSLPDIKKRLPELKDMKIEQKDNELSAREKMAILRLHIEEAEEEVERELYDETDGMDAMLGFDEDEVEKELYDETDRIDKMLGFDEEDDEFMGVDFEALFRMYADICENVYDEDELELLSIVADELADVIMRGMDDYDHAVATVRQLYDVAKETVADFQRERKEIGEKLGK